MKIPPFMRSVSVGLLCFLAAAASYGQEFMETETTVVSTAAQTTHGQPVTFTATVISLVSSSTPTGTVTFSSNALPDSTVPLGNGGKAQFETSALPSGNHTVTATYNGDQNSDPSFADIEHSVLQASTTTTVTIDPASSAPGQSVEVVAVVTPVAPGAGEPTGQVIFSGAGLNESVSLQEGAATVSTTSLTSGTVTATYEGDANFSGSTGTSTATVSSTPSTTSVTASPNPATPRQTVQVTATVSTNSSSSTAPSGTVTFTDSAGLNETVPLDTNGTAGVFVAAQPARTITASYSGGGGSAASSNTVEITVVPEGTTTVVSATPNPAVVGQSVTLAATVSWASLHLNLAEPNTLVPLNGVTPTGTVTFAGPGGLNQTVALDHGVATFTIPALMSGTITATYSGAEDVAKSSSGSVELVVTKAATTTVVTATPDPSVTGQTVALLATVSANSSSSLAPTGSVLFTGPGGLNQTVNLDSAGQAGLQTSALTTGVITATYSGDPASESSVGTTTVSVEPSDTVTALTVLPSSPVFGETATITATVTATPPGSGSPVGSVTFTGPGGLNQSVPLDTSGKASVTSNTLSNGTITATYTSEGGFNGSTTSTPIMVGQGSSSVTLAASPESATYGAPVTLTAAVAAVAPASGTLTGTVDFLDGTTPLGTGTIQGGAATLTTSALAGGSHTLTAVYSGDTNFSTATSTPLALTVAPAEQTVKFPAIGDVEIGEPIALSASASSDLPVTFSIVSGPATLDGSTLTINEEGQVVVRAAQAGNANHAPAFADQTVGAAKLAQTITFAELPDRSATDEAFPLTATASSGLPVTFNVVSGPAMLSDGEIMLTGAAGTVLVRATQAGDARYHPATDVVREFDVAADADRVFFGDFFLTSDVVPSNRGGAQALAAIEKIGEVAAVLSANGNNGSILIVAPTVGINELTAFTLNEDGSFATSVTQRAGPNVPTARTLPVEGELSGNVLSGFIEEVGFSFSTTIQPEAGPSADAAGLYVSTSLNTAAGATYTIVGSNNNVLVLTVTPTVTVGGLATLQSNGTFQLEAAGENEEPVTITGAVNAPANTVSGTILVANQAPVSFAGLEATTSRTDRLMGLSSRGRVGSGERILISGLVIGGTEPKRVMIRAVGPALAELGVANVLVDPQISLFQGSTLIGENDNWATADNAAEIAETAERIGAFGLASESKDATLLRTLEPGAYTVHVHGGEGVALAEIYDASENPQSEYQRLVDIATRGEVGTGENVLIGGIAIAGNSPKRVLIRGVGPGLAAQGVAATLADPVLTVYRGNTVIGQNDNWSTDATVATQITAAETTTGAFHLESGSNDAAILLTLAPGNYTVHIAGANNTTGVALVEVYEVPEE